MGSTRGSGCRRCSRRALPGAHDCAPQQRQRDTQTHRQTDAQTDGLGSRQAVRQARGHADETDEHMRTGTNKQAGSGSKQAYRLTDRQTHTQTDRPADKQTNKQTNKHSNTHVETDIQTD